MKILGIDPGLAVTGYGIVQVEDNHLVCGESGTFKTKAGAIEKRLAYIFNEVSKLIKQEKPAVVSIEEGFYGKNVKVALSLGQARGVIVLACTLNNIPVYEYSPRKIKQSVTGNGAASKEQVSYMITALLGLPEAPKILDISDALATAYCHYQQGKIAF